MRGNLAHLEFSLPTVEECRETIEWWSGRNLHVTPVFPIRFFDEHPRDPAWWDLTHHWTSSESISEKLPFVCGPGTQTTSSCVSPLRESARELIRSVNPSADFLATPSSSPIEFWA